MSETSQIEIQANFLVQRHGARAQDRLLKELKESGLNANSARVRDLKELLKAVTELLQTGKTRQ